MVKGYEGGDNPCDGTHGEGSAEDSEEHAHRLEERRRIEHVGVCSTGLVGHDGPETKHLLFTVYPFHCLMFSTI